MAGPGAVIGSLRAVLGLDTAEFDEGLKRARVNLGQFGKTLGVGLAAAGAAAVSAGVAMGVMVKRAADAADEMSKAAQKAGTTVEALSRLKWAADLSGVSFEGLQTAMARLNVLMTDVASTGSGKAAMAFDALGIKVEDATGAMRSSSDVLNEVADRFARMEDGTVKSSLAISLFGRAGAELIPLLNSGAEGLRQMAEESDRLGLTISTKAAHNAEAFNDNLSRLHASLDGLANRVMEAVIPSLAELTKTFADPQFQTAAGQFASWAVQAINFIAERAQVAATNIQVLKDMFSPIEQRGNLKTLQADFADLLNRRILLQEEIRKTEAGFNIPFVTDHALASMRAELDKLTAEALRYQQRVQDLLSAPPDGAGGGTGGGTTPPSTPPFVPPGFDPPAIDHVAEALRQLQEEGKALEQSLKNPFENLTHDLDLLGAMLNAKAIDWETFTQAAMRAKAATVATVSDMASDVLGSLSGLFKGNKQFAVATAVVDGVSAVAKAFAAYPPPFNLAAAAAAAVGAAANIAALTSVTEDSTSMPGTAASSAPAADAAAVGGRQVGGTLVLNGTNFGGDQIEGIASWLSELVNTGGADELVLAVERRMR